MNTYLQLNHKQQILKSKHKLLIPDLFGFGFCPRPNNFEYGANSLVKHQYDCEKWAKLFIIDLYNHDVISPYIYKKFNVNGMSFGLEDFYFRGHNENSLLDSFYYHIKRISNYMPGYDGQILEIK